MIRNLYYIDSLRSYAFNASHIHDRVQIFNDHASKNNNVSLCDRVTVSSLIV